MLTGRLRSPSSVESIAARKTPDLAFVFGARRRATTSWLWGRALSGAEVQSARRHCENALDAGTVAGALSAREPLLEVPQQVDSELLLWPPREKTHRSVCFKEFVLRRGVVTTPSFVA